MCFFNADLKSKRGFFLYFLSLSCNPKPILGKT